MAVTRRGGGRGSAFLRELPRNLQPELAGEEGGERPLCPFFRGTLRARACPVLSPVPSLP